ASDVAQQISNLSSLKVGLVARQGDHQREVSNLEFEVDRAEKNHKRNQALAAKGFLSAAALEESADKLDQQKRLLANARSTAQAEQSTRSQSINQMDRAINGLNDGLKLVRATADALAVRAPADGRLTDFHLQEGESVKPNDRLGRIDTPERYKLVANVDEFYLNRTALGLKGSVHIGERDYALTVARLNPQIKDGHFTIELQFDGAMPTGLQPGLGVDSRLTLGQPAKATLLSDGAFYADSGGSWAFVLDADGQHASHRPVRLGRRAGGQIEVLDGLKAGERVIVSSYRNFREAQTLRIKDAAA
ncbi:efflux RND transporter periplasmic adaptor subunit, partial [Chitinimonas sp.]|uniref:efflux RND transporter periplasmic adaptor subunit n=1 Tax=Chitinimonas sp. TaxID=1934313 RepID=UPI0035AD8E0A